MSFVNLFLNLKVATREGNEVMTGEESNEDDNTKYYNYTYYPISS